MHFNSETEIDPSDTDKTHYLSEYHNFDDEMATFDKTTFKFLQNLHFRTKVMKFFLGCSPSFGVKKSGMNTNVDEYPSIPRWYFSTCVPF